MTAGNLITINEPIDEETAKVFVALSDICEYVTAGRLERLRQCNAAAVIWIGTEIDAALRKREAEQ